MPWNFLERTRFFTIAGKHVSEKLNCPNFPSDDVSCDCDNSLFYSNEEDALLSYTDIRHFQTI